jgi:enoyl-[acyl-carrier protein] reductase II
MRETIQRTKALTDKPFAFNYMFSSGIDEFSEACLNVAVEEGLKYVVAVGYTVDVEAVKRLKNLGFTVIIRTINPSVEEAKKAEDAGADVYVATGFDEGGCAPDNPIGTFTIVPLIADAVNIPVAAAGGIVESRGVKASLALGADGVFVGTAFVASKESPAAEVTKDAIVKYDSTDTLTVKTKVGYERCLPTKKIIKEFEMQHIDPADVADRWTSSLLDGCIKGDFENGYVSVSSAIGLITEIKSCEEIIDDLFDGVEY